MSYELLDNVEDDIIADPTPWLIIEPHDEYQGFWTVNGFTSDFRFDLRDIIGSHRVLAPSQLEAFMDQCRELGYRAAFSDDPEELLGFYTRLSDEPPIKINSSLPGTVNGFLPFQVRGVNYLRDQPRMGVAQWSTGTGKSVLQAGLLQYHSEHYKLAWSVVKGHNKVNTQRRYLSLLGVDSYVLEGTPTQRQATYYEIDERLAAGEHISIVTNYEKFRDDFVWYEKGTKLPKPHVVEQFKHWFMVDSLFLWDEMPTKLKTRTTKVYRAITKCIYDADFPKWDKRRAEWLRQYMFSATPVENDPEDWFNCVRLMDPDLYGTVKDFRGRYVKRYSHWDPNKPEQWHNLDEMQLRAAHVVHQVDKVKDPEIRDQFPEVLPDPRVIDWDKKHLAMYNHLIDLAELSLEEAEDEGEQINMLGLITILQMYCDIPSMVTHSAALREAWEAVAADAEENAALPPMEGSKIAMRLLGLVEGGLPEDATHTKLLELESILTSEYETEQTIVFSRFNRSFMPPMQSMLDKWGVSYVVYNGSKKAMQQAQDRFQAGDVQVFLSSDRGSDSIDLDAGSVTVNYDFPLVWARKLQRGNRMNRITSVHKRNTEIDLMMASSVELRVAEILVRKEGYHNSLFGGAISDQALSARMTGDDFRYILRG